MRVMWGLVILALSSPAQMVTFSQQDPRLLAAQVEGRAVPGLAFYSVRVCALDAPLSIQPQRLLQIAEQHVRVMEPGLALAAAARAKRESAAGKFWRAIGAIVTDLGPTGYSMYAGIQGNQPGWAPLVAGGVGLVLRLAKTKGEAADAPVSPPATWITSASPAVALVPGGACYEGVFLANDGPDRFQEVLAFPPLPDSTAARPMVPGAMSAPAGPPILYRADGSCDVAATIRAANLWMAGLPREGE